MTMRWLAAPLLTASPTAPITAPIGNKLSAGDLPSAESISKSTNAKRAATPVTSTASSGSPEVPFYSVPRTAPPNSNPNFASA